MTNSARVWMYFLVPTVMGLLAITGRSFWIDECVTAQYVSQPTFSEWRHDLLTTNFAEAQTPLYLLYLWSWDKLFGHSEWSLRVAALPWFGVGVGLLFSALRWVGRGGWAVMAVTLSSAFLWYYLNEARLYAMQFGASCAVVASLVKLARASELTCLVQRRWFRVFLISSIVLSGISIIGMLWAAAAVVGLGVVLSPSEIWRRFKASPVMTFVWFGALSWLAAYYVSTVMRGARASSLATTNLQTMVYVGYELLGFAGLGPGRDALREHGAHALKGYLPVLGLYGMALATVLGAGLVSIWNSPWRTRAVWIGFLISLPALFLLATGVVRHFRVLGRHFTPVLVVILFVLALGVVWLWHHGRVGRFLLVLYLGLATLSSVEVRVAARHRKDDYRAATAFANRVLAEGRRVWWAAAPQGAAYYGMPVVDDPEVPRGAFAIFGQSAAELSQIEQPDVVVVSRRDIYDYQGGLAVVLERGDFSVCTNFPGFHVWERGD